YILAGEVAVSHSSDDDVGNYRYIDEDDHWHDLGMVDVEAETESMRHAAEVRLRAQSNELKRFHDKICQRVTERERQNRLEAQRAQKNLDAKCAKVFSTTVQTQPTGNSVATRLSTRPYFQKLIKDKKAILKDCPLGKHIEKMLRLDAKIRDDLLRSTEPSSYQKISNNDEYGSDEGQVISESAVAPALLPEQRVALYATVRRQYMEMNRAQVKSDWREDSQTNKKCPVSKSPTAGRSRRTRDNSDDSIKEHGSTTSTGVTVIDMTSGCDVRVHRQTTTSSTPWRKKAAKGNKVQSTTREHERFLRALQAQLGTPALCSCAKTGSTQPCANNCALYKQPKKREKLLTSVYKQQQQDVTTAAGSPIR
ncbi:hypothetical protein GN958_ATG09880, partial [Phytophthora infestans]